MILFAATVLTACSSGDEPTALPPGTGPATTTAAPTTAARTTAAPAPSPTTGTRRSPIRWLGPAATGARAPVAAATRDYWSMVVRLAERPDPADPALPRLAAEPQLSKLVTLFTTTRSDKISQRGPIDGTVTVAAVSAAGATVRTCLDQSLTRVYDAAGKIRPGSTGTLTLFTLTLARTGGAWKVTGVTNGDDTCRTR
jgi:hypothetical protein